MEKLKDFVSNKRKTASLALIGAIILLICNSGITQLNIAYMIRNLVYSVSYIGLLIYFINFFRKKKNTKIVNNILIISFGLQMVIECLNLLVYAKYYTFVTIITPIITIVLNAIFFMYLANILIDRPELNKFFISLVTNKVLVITVIIYFAYVTIIGIMYGNFINIIFGIAYLMLLPYLYNYTSYDSKEVSKIEENKVVNNTKKTVQADKEKADKEARKITIIMIAIVLIICAIFSGVGGGSSKKSKWQSLTKEEKAWYERNYGNGKSQQIRDAIDSYKSKSTTKSKKYK